MNLIRSFFIKRIVYSEVKAYKGIYFVKNTITSYNIQLDIAISKEVKHGLF